MNRHFRRYTTRSPAGIPSESRLNGDGIEHAIALPSKRLAKRVFRDETDTIGDEVIRWNTEAK
jgi:hypothetical protein